MEKIGVFLCSCSENISKIIDFKALKEFTANLPNVKIIGYHKLLCSDDGKKFFRQTVQNKGLSRVLIVACSPKQHELTFRKEAEKTDLNPYLIAMANIREQCAYVTEKPDEALEKAKKIIIANYKRLLLQRPLSKNEIIVNADSLVIGGGISGIEAAMLLAQKNRKVYLIEKQPNVGGNVTRQEDLCPNMECATCLMEPKLDIIMHNENIEVLTLSEITDVKGFAGNFEVTVKKHPRYVDKTKCFGSGECHKVCPVDVPNEFNENLDTRKAIYIPYLGCLPFISVIDSKNCLELNGTPCQKCVAACPFGAIDFSQKEEDLIIKCGAIVVSVGHTGYNKHNYLKDSIQKFDGENEINNYFYSASEFERITSQTGPYAGQIQRRDGKKPDSIAIIYASGGRLQKHINYPSIISNLAGLKYNELIHENLPEAKIYNVFDDLSFHDKSSLTFYHEIADKYDFIREENINEIQYTKNKDKITVKLSNNSLNVDMVILLLPIIVNPDAEKIKEILNISADEHGFLKEEHNRTNPAGTEVKGIYLAGTVQGPKSVPESVMQAGAAAGKAYNLLTPGEKMELEAMISVINEEKCSGCKICIALCPYKAISYDYNKKVSMIQPALCTGCGTCVAGCPSGAITANNFEDSQILAELKEVLQ